MSTALCRVLTRTRTSQWINIVFFVSEGISLKELGGLDVETLYQYTQYKYIRQHKRLLIDNL